jgi:hypothetical protein
MSPFFLIFVKLAKLPFGSVIMGNIPTELQISLSGRAKEIYFVGFSDLHNGAVKLFNPTTKRIILRHSYKYLSDVEPSSTTFLTPEDPIISSPLASSDIFHDEPPTITPPDDDEFTLTSRPNSKAPFAYNCTLLK